MRKFEQEVLIFRSLVFMPVGGGRKENTAFLMLNTALNNNDILILKMKFLNLLLPVVGPKNPDQSTVKKDVETLLHDFFL